MKTKRTVTTYYPTGPYTYCVSTYTFKTESEARKHFERVRNMGFAAILETTEEV